MYSDQKEKAQVTATFVQTRKQIAPAPPAASPSIINRAERFTRNFLCAVLVIVCIYAVKTADLPDRNALQAAARSIADVSWEENLGRIQFVGNMFPETTEVFWHVPSAPVLALKPDNAILHAWTKEEPFVAVSLPDNQPYVLADGQINLIAHDHSGQTLVSVIHEKGYETIYYGLETCDFAEGQSVSARQILGQSGLQAAMSFELRQEGLPVDPTPMLSFEEKLP